MDRRYYVYIMTNRNNTVLYTGVTGNLPQRIRQHLEGQGSLFAKRYNVNKLVYFETFDEVRDAIAREKQIKAGSRQKKIDLVNGANPSWEDLTQDTSHL